MKLNLQLPIFRQGRRLKTLLTVAFGSAFLYACGGSDSGISVSGVAATGAAMSKAAFSVRCAAGSVSGLTGTDGSYSAFVKDGGFPCLIEVSNGTTKLHSVALGSNGSAVANVTPLTEALVAQFSADTADFFANFDRSTALTVTSDRVKTAQSAVLSSLASAGTSVPSSLTDLIGDSLVAKTSVQVGNDYDKLLDLVGSTPVQVKLIALNDFHGNIEPTAETNGGTVVLPDGAAGTKAMVGGAAYLATLVQNIKAKNPNNIMVGAGDMISASPFASSITHDEAAVDVLNQIGLEVTSVGNHEFDRGMTELKRIQNGGCYPASGTQGVVGSDTCLISGTYPGARFKYLAANVVETSSGKSIFPATYVKRFGTVSVGFIGLTLQGTPNLVTATGVAGLRFDEESATINKYAAQLKANGVNAVVVLIHQGGQTTATTINDQTCPGLSGEILPVMDKLSADVDVVVSGHTHQEYVCKYPGKAAGKNILMTSTGFYGSAVSEIDLTIQPNKGVVAAAANTVPVIRAPGTFTIGTTYKATNASLPSGFSAVAKDSTVDALVAKYVTLSATLASQSVGTITASINRALLPSTTSRDETAEGAMGDVMADSYLAGVPGGADIAFVNPGGVRADLTFVTGGAVTYSNLSTVEPFGNTLATLNLTGAQILRLLEQQWEAPNKAVKSNPAALPSATYGPLLQVSKGFTYSFDNAQPAGATVGSGNRLVAGSVKLNGIAIDPTKTYKIVTNAFLAAGGDNFTVMATGTNLVDTKVLDLDAFIAYFRANSPVSPPAPRITRLN